MLEQVKLLNKYRNAWYNDTNEEHREVAKALDYILPILVRVFDYNKEEIEIKPIKEE